MDAIDRSAVVVKLKQPFIDWANSFEGPRFEECSDWFNVYLLPDCESEEDEKRFLRKYFTKIFEGELTSWNLDKSTWPNIRDFKIFETWFEVSFHSLVFDLTL